MKNTAARIFSVVFPLFVCAVVVVALVLAIKSAGLKNEVENEAIIENGIRRAAIACYCSEGAFPTSIDYLVKNYGLNVNTLKYTIYFNAISSNLMPEIKVITK